MKLSKNVYLSMPGPSTFVNIFNRLINSFHTATPVSRYYCYIHCLYEETTTKLGKLHTSSGVLTACPVTRLWDFSATSILKFFLRWARGKRQLFLTCCCHLILCFCSDVIEQSNTLMKIGRNFYKMPFLSRRIESDGPTLEIWVLPLFSFVTQDFSEPQLLYIKIRK